MKIPTLETLTFPAGEVHVKATPEFDCDIYGIYNSIYDGTLVYLPKKLEESINDYLFRLLMTCDVVGRRETYSIFLPYLPYARQDRITNENEPFSLMILGEVLNQITAADEIFTLDVHSDVARGIIPNLRNISVSHFLEIANIVYEDYTLVIPDQGADKRLSKLTKFQRTVLALKHRDTGTGKITLKDIYGDVEGQDCLIVDDICDGGYTFILISQELKKRGANSVTLAVTHGVFSKGFVDLKASGIDKIITTDSFPNIPEFKADMGLQVVPCLDIFNHFVNVGMPY